MPAREGLQDNFGLRRGRITLPGERGQYAFELTKDLLAIGILLQEIFAVLLEQKEISRLAFVKQVSRQPPDGPGWAIVKRLSEAHIFDLRMDCHRFRAATGAASPIIYLSLAKSRCIAGCSMRISAGCPGQAPATQRGPHSSVVWVCDMEVDWRILLRSDSLDWPALGQVLHSQVAHPQ